MKYFFYYILFLFLVVSCSEQIKNTESSVVEEEGTEVVDEATEKKEEAKVITHDDYFGFWVGYFEPDEVDEYDKGLHVDEGYSWFRENKINIMIQTIENGFVTGRSVIAGNDRPFKGTLKGNVFELKEPGDDKHDGTFNFTIEKDTLTGKWLAYKKIDIRKRKYKLTKKIFKYNKDVALERSKQYVNWNSFTSKNETYEYDDDVVEEWIRKEFSTATDAIYKINASNTVLTKKMVENLKKGDLVVIRNAIYARHGYSFKNRPMRVFFDAQSWYVPMSVNIKSELTQLEKDNIQLLLRYEKNASEYYDYFGRG